jgi:prepilin-type N-terminal cleavage/methylation domain-containing protein
MILRFRKKTGTNGFTLTELMIVVSIIGILAAVAIPAFIGYVRKSKASEVNEILDRCFKGVIEYYEKPHLNPVGDGTSFTLRLPPNTGTASPAGKACTAAGLDGRSGYIAWPARAAGNVTDLFTNLNWIITDPIYGCYEYVRGGSVSPTADMAQAFDCYGYTDIDNDNQMITWDKRANYKAVTRNFGAGAVFQSPQTGW